MRTRHWIVTLCALAALASTAAAQSGWGGGQGRGHGQGIQRRDRDRQCWSATQPATGGSAPAATQPTDGRFGVCPHCRCGKGRGAGHAGQGRGFMGGRHQATTQPAGHHGRHGLGATQPAGAHRVSDAEHQLIQKLVSNHQDIKRTVRDIPGGVETVTTTSRPELVKALREHVTQMVERLHQKKPLRMWDSAFRDVFARADEISVKVTEIDDGVMVTETTSNADVVPVIRAHARAVSRFTQEGAAAVRPPWAGRG